VQQLHQFSLVVSRNTILVPSVGLRIGPACEAGLSAGMRRERVSPQIRKKERQVKSQFHLRIFKSIKIKYFSPEGATKLMIFSVIAF